MSELPEPTNTTPPAGATPQKPYWLYRFAAWVVIVAGIVFIASTIFFTGAYVGHHRGGHHHHHCHHHSMGHRHHHHRDMGPGAPGEGGHGPGEVPQSVAPSVAPPGR